MLGRSSHPPNVKVTGAGGPGTPRAEGSSMAPLPCRGRTGFPLSSPKSLPSSPRPRSPAPFASGSPARADGCPYRQRISSSPITYGRLCRCWPPLRWTRSGTAALRQLLGAGATREGPGVGWGVQGPGLQQFHASPAMRNPPLLCSLGAHAESRQRRGCFDWKRKK